MVQAWAGVGNVHVNLRFLQMQDISLSDRSYVFHGHAFPVPTDMQDCFDWFGSVGVPFRTLWQYRNIHTFDMSEVNHDCFWSARLKMKLLNSRKLSVSFWGAQSSTEYTAILVGFPKGTKNYSTISQTICYNITSSYHSIAGDVIWLPISATGGIFQVVDHRL